MRRFEIYRRGTIVIERGFPTRDAHAPFITWLQTGKSPFRMWRDQIVPVQDREVEKFLRHLHADGVLAEILRAGSTIAIAIKPGYRVATTTSQICAEDIGRHGEE